MATRAEPRPSVEGQPANVVDMNWDPISRIVGNLGI